MKSYSVYFTEPIAYTYIDARYNKDTRKWEDVEIIGHDSVFTFHSLSTAKKFIKEHIDKYKSSCITKTWANGDFENLGEINIKGNNKTFVANTKQKIKNY